MSKAGLGRFDIAVIEDGLEKLADALPAAQGRATEDHEEIKIAGWPKRSSDDRAVEDQAQEFFSVVLFATGREQIEILEEFRTELGHSSTLTHDGGGANDGVRSWLSRMSWWVVEEAI